MEAKVTVRLREIRRVSRSDLQYKFKLVKRVAYPANLPRNVILRQMYARKMIEILADPAKKVLCIDQSWLNSMTFARRKWRKRGSGNSYGARNLNARVSLICAISTEGDVFMSVTQVNTTEDVMVAFFQRLAGYMTQRYPR